MRYDELSGGKKLATMLAVVQKAKAVADAAVGWWEDHGLDDCHFCQPQVPLGSHDGRSTHDVDCPVGEYVEALREASLV